jgi:hypothetical protein
VNGSSFGLLGACDPVAARTAFACFASPFSSSAFVGGVAAPAASPLDGVPAPDDVGVGAVVVLGVVVVVPGVLVVVDVVGVVAVVVPVVDVVGVVVVVLDVVVVVVLDVVVVVLGVVVVVTGVVVVVVDD